MEYWKQELYHHGILGQKWGKRNGPPYPLGSSDHSVSERKAGWRKSLGGGRNPQDYAQKRGLSDKQKRALKIAGMAALGGLAVYGAYKYSDMRSNARPAIELGMKFVSTYDKKPQKHTVESITIDPLRKIADENNKTFDDMNRMIDDMTQELLDKIANDQKKNGTQLKWDLPTGNNDNSDDDVARKLAEALLQTISNN